MKYWMYSPNMKGGRLYIHRSDGKRTSTIATMHQWNQEVNGGRNDDAEDVARRIVALLNAFEDISTEDLEGGLFSVAASFTSDYAAQAVDAPAAEAERE